jgi:uncharacterized membrane protein (UPF0182 family)
MSNLKQKLAIAIGLLTALVPSAAFAQSYDYTTSSSDAASGAAAAGIGVFVLVIFAIAAIIGVVSLIFWIMMLVHATSNDIPDKGVWIAVLVVSLVIGAGLIGALVYYFVVKRKFDEAHPKATAAPSASAKK